MKQVYTVKLLAGSHHCNRSGNAYEVIPDKTEQASDGSDKGRLVKGVYPVFKTGIKLWEIFKNKFAQVPDDTPTTHPADGYATEAPVVTAPVEEASVPAHAAIELAEANSQQAGQIVTLETALADHKVLLNAMTSKCEHLQKDKEELQKQVEALTAKAGKKKG